MWKTILSAAFLFALSSLPVAVGLAVASEDPVCKAPQGAAPMSNVEAAAFGTTLGYRITKVEKDRGCLELSGTDRNGASIELTLNPYDKSIMTEGEVR
jgi:hypothetical protein